MARCVRVVLVGLGNLGWRFCDLLAEKAAAVEERYGLRLVLVGVADSHGTAHDAHGLDPGHVAEVKRSGGTTADLGGAARAGEDAVALIARAEADVLCEATPVNLERGGEPGLTHVRSALSHGMHVVTPNKGPLVVAYQELHQLAARHGVQLRFDGTVAGGLPAVNLGQRDMRGATVARIEAVPNMCTGYVLHLLSAGRSWEQALQQARAEGILEADPAFDLEGWDAAAKLVILANAVMEVPARLDDVDCAGIVGLSGAEVQAAQREGGTLKLLATAVRRADGGADLRVAPTQLPADHFLARLGHREMGVVYHTDIYGTVMAAIDEPTPLPSAATMLRDLLDIFAA